MAWRVSEEQKMMAPKWAHFLGGGAGAMLGAMVTSPLEVVKTRLQAQRHKATITGGGTFGMRTFNSIRMMIHQEGLRGLYRGLGATLGGVIPSRSIHFFVYGTSKKELGHYFPQPDHWAIPMFAAALAGATVTTATCPLWTVKTRLQLQVNAASETLYNGMWDAFVQIYRTEGVRALYKGLGASYLGLVETVLQFTLYESLKEKVSKRRPVDKQSLRVHEYLALSSAAKLVAAACTYPHEVIRTRLREQRGNNGKYRGPIHGLYVIATEEGTAGLYGGMGAHLIRVVPNAALLFLVYELTLVYITRDIPMEKEAKKIIERETVAETDPISK